MIQLEVCANSVASALAAQNGGAHRVELCENLHEGGTTPSHGQVKIARELLHIKLHALLRPRLGDFLYTDIEFQIMLADLHYLVSAGCDGVVLGILNADSTVDVPRCRILIDIAKQHGLSVTFHRAFDLCADMDQALEDVIQLGCDRILTSGGKTTAIEGANKIAHLIQKAAGRIIIMPGAGISELNAADLVHYTGATEIHSSARTQLQSAMTYHNSAIIFGNSKYADDYAIDVTGTEVVKRLLAKVNQGSSPTV
ncbi:copper homeostasis protein CutC [Mucilaginibacter robiniae]|uniref:PF03932 family protein CutC n=1 Tax=Mucilaginibacter robiniae TaxID=2728022 RepID=A0A7L5E4H7_9SPHI|nr:copper homeostasis protein CutC [Mucilaginibacter robiniae]QJD97975.1 copper homeostasis protein CutC [Mucilaginibacter robiniae]